MLGSDWVIQVKVLWLMFLTRLCDFLVKRLGCREPHITKHCSLSEVWVRESVLGSHWKLLKTEPTINAILRFKEEVEECVMKGYDKHYLLISLRDGKVLASYRASDERGAVQELCYANNRNFECV